MVDTSASANLQEMVHTLGVLMPKEIMNFREKIKCVAYQGWVWEQVLKDLVTEFRIMERAWTLEPQRKWNTNPNSASDYVTLVQPLLIFFFRSGMWLILISPVLWLCYRECMKKMLPRIFKKYVQPSKLPFISHSSKVFSIAACLVIVNLFFSNMIPVGAPFSFLLDPVNSLQCVYILSVQFVPLEDLLFSGAPQALPLFTSLLT